VIPPLSPLDIPSTSSIIIKVFIKLAELWRPNELFYSNLTPFLFLISLALNSTILNPSSWPNNLAVVVFPSPGSPLNKAAFEFIVPVGKNPLSPLTYFLLPLK